MDFKETSEYRQLIKWNESPIYHTEEYLYQIIQTMYIATIFFNTTKDNTRLYRQLIRIFSSTISNSSEYPDDYSYYEKLIMSSPNDFIGYTFIKDFLNKQNFIYKKYNFPKLGLLSIIYFTLNYKDEDLAANYMCDVLSKHFSFNSNKIQTEKDMINLLNGYKRIKELITEFELNIPQTHSTVSILKDVDDDFKKFIEEQVSPLIEKYGHGLKEAEGF